jgi:putative MFS transporter
MMVDRVPRRLFLVGSFALAACAMLILFTWRNIPAVPMTIAFSVFAGVLSAASNLVYVYLPELFPTDLRASGIGLAVAASRIGSAISTFLLPIIVTDYGVHAALGICVAVLVLGTVICLRWAPETRHVPLGSLDTDAPRR